MKKLSFIFLFVTSIFAAGAQNNSSDLQAIKMLKQFYIAYNTVWSTAKYPHLQKKLDSLQRKYCTIWLRKQLKELAKGEGADHDLLTNDEPTDISHLNTLKVIKDGKKPNSFIVSYVDHTMNPSYKPIDKTVVIYISVEKENGNYKIANAYGDAISL